MKVKEISTIREFIDAIRIRVEVFVNEQGFKPGWEPDEDDKKARQFIILKGKKVIGTLRARKSGKGFKIERMAISKDGRQGGAGRMLLAGAVKALKRSHPRR